MADMQDETARIEDELIGGSLAWLQQLQDQQSLTSFTSTHNNGEDIDEFLVQEIQKSRNPRRRMIRAKICRLLKAAMTCF